MILDGMHRGNGLGCTSQVPVREFPKTLTWIYEGLIE
jgi:hypothetical protein